MKAFIDNNYLWFAPIFSFIVAQLMKYVVYAVQYKVFRKERLTGAGGMPSSHSSGVCTLIIVMAVSQGTNSPMFALALILGLIVMYDAAGVRRAAGLHAKVINILKRSMDELDGNGGNNEQATNHEEEKADKPLKEFVGHTPLEVLCGAIVGVLLGLLFVL
ncbi:MAG: divergent PAP2 family protein [Oscillospiraceae bacterium]|nr:divergent PAP2 family protein [Oscillospiraceae bacterium]